VRTSKIAFAPAAAGFRWPTASLAAAFMTGRRSDAASARTSAHASELHSTSKRTVGFLGAIVDILEPVLSDLRAVRCLP